MQKVRMVVGCCIKTEMENSESQGLPLGLCSLKDKPNLSCVKCSSPLTPRTIKRADMRCPGEQKNNRVWKNHSRIHEPLVPDPSAEKTHLRRYSSSKCLGQNDAG